MYELRYAINIPLENQIIWKIHSIYVGILSEKKIGFLFFIFGTSTFSIFTDSESIYKSYVFFRLYDYKWDICCVTELVFPCRHLSSPYSQHKIQKIIIVRFFFLFLFEMKIFPNEDLNILIEIFTFQTNKIFLVSVKNSGKY